MVCQLTGRPHRLFFMRAAWWCADCTQKIESCCDGGGCPSLVDLFDEEKEGPVAQRLELDRGPSKPKPELLSE